MKELSDYKLRKISKELEYCFNAATKQNIIDGMNWYKNANGICNAIAEKFNTTNLIAASVLSVLSPRNKWKQNILDAYKVFTAVQDGVRADEIKVCTFHTNKYKAFAVAEGKVTITDKSLKTFNFVYNIAHLDNNFLTIDIWHLRACFNKSIKIGSAAIGRVAYSQIKALTQRNARALGMTGFEYQAILWCSVRENYEY